VWADGSGGGWCSWQRQALSLQGLASHHGAPALSCCGGVRLLQVVNGPLFKWLPESIKDKLNGLMTATFGNLKKSFSAKRCAAAAASFSSAAAAAQRPSPKGARLCLSSCSAQDRDFPNKLCRMHPPAPEHTGHLLSTHAARLQERQQERHRPGHCWQGEDHEPEQGGDGGPAAAGPLGRRQGQAQLRHQGAGGTKGGVCFWGGGQQPPPGQLPEPPTFRGPGLRQLLGERGAALMTSPPLGARCRTWCCRR
jgi:hypothetical protein